MQWEFTPYSIPLFICSLMLCAVIAVCLQRRATPGALYLALMGCGAAAYVLGYAVEIGSTSPAQVLTSLKFQYLSYFSPPLLLLAILLYTGDRHWITPVNVIVLFSIAAITLVLAFTNEYHGLIWQITALDRSDGFTRTHFDAGAWYWVGMVYTRGLAVVGAVVLIAAYRRMSASVYRHQILSMLAIWVIPVLATFVNIVGWFPRGFDVVPYALTFTVLIMAWALFRYRLLDLMPIAREAILQSMSEVMFVIDRENRLVYMNPAAQHATHLDIKKVIGAPASSALSAWIALPPQALLDERAQTEIQAQVRGETRYFNMTQVPLNDARGRKKGHLLVMTDLTERVRAEHALQEAYDQREKLVDDLEAFAHMVAHDLKNPLSTIIGLSDILSTDYLDMPPERVQVHLNSMYASATKADLIIDALLLLARMRAGMTVNIHALDMGQIVNDVCNHLRPLITSLNAEIIQPSAWGNACGYAPWVEAIWTNYISNALKYGGRPAVVELGCTPQPENLIRYWVKDNGAGLRPEQINQLFTPFTRLNERPIQGYGLGLTVVQRIAERLNGSVGVESEVGKGSTFYFTLPAVSMSQN